MQVTPARIKAEGDDKLLGLTFRAVDSSAAVPGLSREGAARPSYYATVPPSFLPQAFVAIAILAAIPTTKSSQRCSLTYVLEHYFADIPWQQEVMDLRPRAGTLLDVIRQATRICGEATGNGEIGGPGQPSWPRCRT